jgi:hypothetical protein
MSLELGSIPSQRPIHARVIKRVREQCNLRNFG